VAVGFIALVAATIAGAIWVSHAQERKAAATYPKCQGRHAAHQAVFEHDKVVPFHTEAKRCDTLTITNLDDRARYLAFGQHQSHGSYAGVSERYLSTKGSLTFTLVKPGNFRFHDHIDDPVYGTFSVK